MCKKNKNRRKINMKQNFIDFINALIAAAPDVAESLMTDEIRAYLDAICEKEADKPDLTDNGKLVLEYMQKATDTTNFKSRDIAEGLFVSTRMVSGAMRKLVNDGFCDRIGKDPIVYILTEKGKNYKID
jgi:DNA-binding MarR family transcriptional regulator